jgi:hypothetical protein
MRDYAQALTMLAPAAPDDGEPWSEERLAAALAPYWAAHATMVTTPAARRPHNTIIQPLGDRRWRAQQRIIDPAGDEDWAIECIVDLNDSGGDTEAEAETSAPPKRSLLALQRIGI